MGYSVQMVEGSQENIKVTTPEDLWLAERIISMREVRCAMSEETEAKHQIGRGRRI